MNKNTGDHEANDGEYSCDFLVIGSGGGGMTAAVTAHNCGLKTLVVEKTKMFGGTTAFSGGVIWIPNNPLSAAVGIDDSEAEAREYLLEVAASADPERRETYLRRASEMLRYMLEHSEVDYRPTAHYMDYYPEIAGAKPGGRSLDPAPYSAGRLGREWLSIRRPNYGSLISRYSITASEAHSLMRMNFRSWLFLITRLLRYWLDLPFRLRGWPDRRLTLGRALAARLRKSMLQRDIPLWRRAEALRLSTENGRVTGAVIRRDGKELTIRARCGVLLASGGFSRNNELRRSFHSGRSDAAWSPVPEGDTGDGIRMGLEVGGVVDHPEAAWWTPTYLRPDGSAEALIIGKSMPGVIFVNSGGRRFVNEAAPYEDVVKVQRQAHSEQDPCIPCFMIFDQRVRRLYPAGPVPPLRAVPESALPRELREFLWRGDTLAELAGKLNIDPKGLEQTVEHFNKMAVAGKDLDFGRGESLHDRYYSDPRITPNPNLAPLAEGPFYGFPVYPGDLGTKGGLRCDVHGRVCREDGSAIDGLYATGNCSSPALGDSYPGAGSTIGPSMTFGYIAARHAAGLEQPATPSAD